MNKYLAIFVSFWLCTGSLVSVISEQLPSDPQMFTGPAHQDLPRFKDFTIYRDNPDNILSEGYFDTSWQITKEQEAGLRKIPGLLLL